MCRYISVCHCASVEISYDFVPERNELNCIKTEGSWTMYQIVTDVSGFTEILVNCFSTNCDLQIFYSSALFTGMYNKQIISLSTKEIIYFY